MLIGGVVPTAAPYHKFKPHWTVVQFKSKAAGGTGEAKKEASAAGEVRAKDAVRRVDASNPMNASSRRARTRSRLSFMARHVRY